MAPVGEEPFNFCGEGMEENEKKMPPPSEKNEIFSSIQKIKKNPLDI